MGSATVPGALMAVAVLLLGAAFLVTYRRKTASAADGSGATTGPTRRAKALLWGIPAMAAFAFALPYWSGSRLNDANAHESAAPTTRTAYIEVKGMVQQLGIT